MASANGRRDARRRPDTPGRAAGELIGMLVVVAAALSGSVVGFTTSAGASPLWSTMPTPGLGGSDGVLNGVSCPSATSCFAVGSSTRGNGDRAQLVVRWDGTTWSKMPTPDRVGVLESSLKGVSCPSATFCFAVGDETSKRVNDGSLIEEWNGQTWSQSASAAPYVNYLSGGVSCASPSACFVVGGEDAAHRSVLQYWNGVEWSVMTDPNPVEAALGAVSCPSTTSCFAVGSERAPTASPIPWRSIGTGAAGR